MRVPRKALLSALVIAAAGCNPSTSEDRCADVVCSASDQCHDAGTCDPETGLCSDPPAAESTPCADGDACTQGDACVAGVCVGAPVTCGDGQTCNASTGTCEAPAPPVVDAIAPSNGAIGVGVNAEVQVRFSAPMNPATLTAAAAPGPCTGSLQLSSDDFASCLGLGAPVPSEGNTVATSVPVGGLSFGTTYRVRITTAARSAAGQPMAAPATQSNGFTTRVDACGAGLVISQIYGGGGSAGAPYRNDFVELRNAGTDPASTSGMALQWQSAGGVGSWSVQALPAVTVPAGGYFLIQQAAGADTTRPALPAPDFIPPGQGADLSASSGKVALTSTTVPLVGATTTATVVDLVGFGPGANAFEAAAGPSPAGSTALVRSNGGCADANHNALDLAVGPPTPRSSSTTSGPCACTANETGSALEMDYCNLQHPPATSTAAGVATEGVYARVFEDGFTQGGGADNSIVGQFGYGPSTVNPSTHPEEYVWAPAVFNVQIGNDDEYRATLTAPAAGSYGYAARFTRDGRRWTYCDLNGAGSSSGLWFDAARLGSLTVTP